MRNKNFKKLLTLATLAISTSTILWNSESASAQVQSNVIQELETKINQQLDLELNQFITENNLNVEIEGASISIEETALQNYENLEEIELAIKKDIEDFKKVLSNSSISIEKSKVQPLLEDNGTYYTAVVNSSVPGVGWGYIKQDFKASLTSTKINSITFIGSSYTSGFTIERWTPNYPYEEISSDKTTAEINMKGTYSYGIGDFTYDYPCTFMEKVKVSNGKLVHVNPNS